MRELRNKEGLVSLLLATLKNWAYVEDLCMPSSEWLCKYRFEYSFGEDFESTYDGKTIRAIGSHRADPGVISVACGCRTQLNIFQIWIHELGHAVQFYNLGSAFMTEYRTEAKAQVHGDNKYEEQVRRLERTLRNACLHDDELYNRIQAFKPLQVSVADIEANRDFVRLECERSRIREYYGPVHDDWYNTPEFRGNRRKWWLRR